MKLNIKVTRFKICFTFNGPEADAVSEFLRKQFLGKENYIPCGKYSVNRWGRAWTSGTNMASLEWWFKPTSKNTPILKDSSGIYFTNDDVNKAIAQALSPLNLQPDATIPAIEVTPISIVDLNGRETIVAYENPSIPSAEVANLICHSFITFTNDYLNRAVGDPDLVSSGSNFDLPPVKILVGFSLLAQENRNSNHPTDPNVSAVSNSAYSNDYEVVSNPTSSSSYEHVVNPGSVSCDYPDASSSASTAVRRLFSNMNIHNSSSAVSSEYVNVSSSSMSNRT